MRSSALDPPRARAWPTIAAATMPDSISVVAVEDVARLAEWVPEWEELAAGAIEPNVFYEPWQMLPAVEAFGKHSHLIHLLVFSVDPGAPSARPLLCAYFPLERVRRFRGMPVAALTLWKHMHCFLCTPLIRPGYAAQSLAALLEWARTDPRGAAIVQLQQVAGDGIFKRALVDILHERNRPAFISGTHDRALFVPREDADRYMLASMSTKSRKQVRRLTRRLAEAGSVEFAELDASGDLGAWVEDFLALEASGWKGRTASALACHESQRRFFTNMTREAFRRGRLMMLAMTLNGRPVAMKCNLLAGPAAFSFKIAFDETFERFSPGVLLEVENIRRLHACAGLEWMDSCAVADHSMANRLWIDRRKIETIAVASGRPMGGFFVRTMPLARLVLNIVRPRPRRAERVGTGTGEESHEPSAGDRRVRRGQFRPEAVLDPASPDGASPVRPRAPRRVVSPPDRPSGGVPRR